MMILLSSGLGGWDEGEPESEKWLDFLFHNGNEYDFAMTTGILEWVGLVFMIKTHSCIKSDHTTVAGFFRRAHPW